MCGDDFYWGTGVKDINHKLSINRLHSTKNQPLGEESDKMLAGGNPSVPLTALFVHLEMLTWPPQDAAVAKSFNIMVFHICWLTWHGDSTLVCCCVTCGHWVSPRAGDLYSEPPALQPRWGEGSGGPLPFGGGAAEIRVSRRRAQDEGVKAALWNEELDSGDRWPSPVFFALQILRL